MDVIRAVSGLRRGEAWAIGGVGRVVFGQSVESLAVTCPDDGVSPRLDLPCRTVFATGLPRVEVIGPLLEDEAGALRAPRPVSRRLATPA